MQAFEKKMYSGLFCIVSINFSEAVSDWVLADQKRVCPKACFCDLGLFVRVHSDDGSLAKTVKVFRHCYTMSNWSGLLLALCEPCWRGIWLNQCQISDFILFLCQCITSTFSVEFSWDWFLLRDCPSSI